MNTKFIEIIKKLSSSCGVSGREQDTAHLVAECFSEFCSEVEIDKMGNVIGIKRSGIPGASRFMLDAHYDEVGLVVTGIDDNGFLNFSQVGGIDRKGVLANEVTVHGKNDLYGVICAKPPHLLKDGEKDLVPEFDDLYIDIGFNGEKVKQLVSIGDFISFRSTPRTLVNNRICGKALDDRAGVLALIACGLYLKEVRLSCDLYFVASVQEETGHVGAASAAYRINPTHAIAVDVTFGESPDAPAEKVSPLSSGGAIGISPILNYDMSQRLITLAGINSIPYQLEVMAGRTSTNADDISKTRCGIKTGLISIPLKYMHTTIETLDMEDVLSTARLMALYIKDGREI